MRTVARTKDQDLEIGARRFLGMTNHAGTAATGTGTEKGGRTGMMTDMESGVMGDGTNTEEAVDMRIEEEV